jgi:hypothetical protein
MSKKSSSPDEPELTHKQSVFIEAVLSGMSDSAAAAAAGSSSPKDYAISMKNNERIQAIITERKRKISDEVDFGRKQAHEMYMDAHMNAETASEQIMAINALVKLHGLEKPKQVEVKHDVNHTHELQLLPTEELMKLAGMDSELTLDGEFEEIEDKPQLEAPAATEGNTIDEEELPGLPENY